MIGFKTLAALLQAGYTVRAAVRTQARFDKIQSLPPIQPYKRQLSSVIVPDITTSGAYDEAAQGVKYIVHVASPLGGNIDSSDYESEMIRPAIQGTVGVLQSAVKAGGIQRVVITGSIVSIKSMERAASEEVIDGELFLFFPPFNYTEYYLLQCRLNVDIANLENTLDVNTKPPFRDALSAYSASKALSFAAAKEFIRANNPSFDVIHILPVYVLGRDETVSDAPSITKGTNGLLMGPLLGYAHDRPLSGSTVDVADVAKMHVLALDPKIKGNQDFLAAADSPFEWADSCDIVKRRYPEECARGVFNMDEMARTTTIKTSIDNSRAKSVLGMRFKTFEEQVVSVVDHFLELQGQA